MTKKKRNNFSLQNLENTLFKRKNYVHKNWLGDHPSWAPYGIGMRIEDILKFCFWISLNQCMLSLLCSRIQGYMLSLMNEVDPYVASAVGFVWDAKPIFFNTFMLALSILRLITTLSVVVVNWLTFSVKVFPPHNFITFAPNCCLVFQPSIWRRC